MAARHNSALGIPMSDTKTHLARLHSLVGEFKSHSGDEVIGKMLPEFAELVVALGAKLDAAQRTMVRLTWAVIALTVILQLHPMP